MRHLSISMVAIGWVLGCGGPGAAAPPASAASEPQQHTQLVEQACDACRDSACFRDARARFDAEVEAAGGFDELPASAYAAHQRLQRCTLAYTDDVPLAFARAREVVCACTSADCVSDFAGDWPLLMQDLEAASQADRAEADADRTAAEQCFTARSINAADYLVVAAQAADRVCACTSTTCAQEAMDARRDLLAGRTYIADGEERAAARAADERTCECFSEHVARTSAEAISRMLGGLSVSGRWSIDCQLGEGGEG